MIDPHLRNGVNMQLSRGLRRWRLLPIVSALAMAFYGVGLGQEDHGHHAAPMDSDSDLVSVLTRTTTTQVSGVSVAVSAIWATPAYFERELDEAAAAIWKPDTGVVILLSEATHSEDLPSQSVAEGAVLEANGVMFQPELIESTVTHPHHRMTAMRFALTPNGAGEIVLRLAGGQSMSWNGDRLFGISDDEQLVTVSAARNGFQPAQLKLRVGEPVVLLFRNESAFEHHFHIVGLEPENLRWFRLDEHDLDSFDASALESAERVSGHLCTAESGLCRLGTNVHLHANPQQFDAVGFTPTRPGRYQVICPLHAVVEMQVVVE